MATTSTDVESQANNLDSPQARSTETERSWYSDWGNVVLIPMVGLVVLYIAWLSLEWGTSQTQEFVQEITFVPLMALGAVFAFRVARLVRDDRQTSRSWTIIGIAVLCWLAGDTAWALHVIFGDGFPVISIESVTFVFAVILIVIGTLNFPSIGVSEHTRRVFRLDSSIILIGIIAIVAFYVFGPDRLRYTIGVSEDFTLFIYSAVTSTTLYLIYHAIVRRPAARLTGPLILMAAGLTVVAVTNLVWTYFEVRGEALTGGPVYMFWMVGQALFVVAPQLHYDLCRRRWSLSRVEAIVDRSHAVVPYVATGIGMIVLMSTGVYILMDRLGVVIILVLTLIGLIVARQVVSLRQNAQFQAQQAIRETENWFGTLVRYSSDMVTVIDREFRCGYQSPSAPEVSRHLPDSPVGTRFLDWVHPGDRPVVERALDTLLHPGADVKTTKVEWRLISDNEKLIHFETIISNRLDDPTVRGLVLNTRDVSERKELEGQLVYQAYHDPLTELPNRTMFFERLDEALSLPGDEADIALLFIDVDDFKLINDRHGHDVGDEFLQAFAYRVRSALRPDDSLFRLAGDEFTIILPGVGSEDEARAIAERILVRLREPFNLFGIEAFITSSIGVTVSDGARHGPFELVRQADVAMYVAKDRGPGCSVVYDHSMDDPQSSTGRIHRR